MGSYKNFNHMKYIQAVLFASAYGALSLDDDNVTLTASQSIDGDNLKVDLSGTMKSGKFDADIGGASFMYMLTNLAAVDGKKMTDV